MVDYPDIFNYTREELFEEFCRLFDRHQELREINEADTQRIHELKRSLETATAAQSYLSQELEHYTNSDTTKAEKELEKTNIELTELRKKYGKLEESFSTLQLDYITLLEQNSTLKQSLEEITRRQASAPVLAEYITSEEDIQRIHRLEMENEEMLGKIEEFQERTVRYTLTIGEYEKNIEILRDKINCLEENLQSKKEDLEEKIQILDSTQDQLAEANAKIAMLSAAPETTDHKGNSLFAEVDDQRQEMRKLLTAQKQSYSQMKKIYLESEHEIRRLKRENIAMHTELEACSSIFCNADKVYQDKLNERIRHLMNHNEDLERKLNWAQERIKTMASEKGVLWIDSMLSLCKKETDDLKSQLHSVRLQNANLEEQLRNSQQDMVRWRFESLKSRCILLDREQILKENNIKFKPVQAIEFKITEKQTKEARPRIVSMRRSSTFELLQGISLSPSTAVQNVVKTYSAQKDVANNGDTKEQELNHKTELSQCPKKEQNDEIVNEACEKFSKQKDENNTAAEENNTQDTQCREENINMDKQSEEKENNLSEPGFISNSKFSKLKANPPSPMLPSQRTEKITPVQSGLLSKEPNTIVKVCNPKDRDLSQNMEMPDFKNPEKQQKEEIVNEAYEKFRKQKNENITADENNTTDIQCRKENNFKGEQSEEKENSLSEPGFTNNSKFSKLKANPPSPMRPSQRSEKITSILTKQRDLLPKETYKNVQFSSEENLIHHLSPTKTPNRIVVCEESSSCTKRVCNTNVGNVATTTALAPAALSAKNSKSVPNATHGKSGIVVRRIVIGSKRD